MVWHVITTTKTSSIQTSTPPSTHHHTTLDNTTKHMNPPRNHQLDQQNKLRCIQVASTANESMLQADDSPYGVGLLRIFQNEFQNHHK